MALKKDAAAPAVSEVRPVSVSESCSVPPVAEETWTELRSISETGEVIGAPVPVALTMVNVP